MKQVRLLFSTFRGHGVARQTSTMLFCAAILGATVLLASAPGDLGQKEIRTQRPPHMDGGVGVLTSLNELVKLSDAVVIGRVTGSRSSNLAPAGLPVEAGLFLSTAYRMNLGTVVVWPEDVEKPKSIEVELLGVGDHDRGGHIGVL